MNKENNYASFSLAQRYNEGLKKQVATESLAESRKVVKIPVR